MFSGMFLFEAALTFITSLLPRFSGGIKREQRALMG